MDMYWIIALLLVFIVSIPSLVVLVYYSWRNGISPMPTSALVRHEVSKQVQIAVERMTGLHQQEQNELSAGARLPKYPGTADKLQFCQKEKENEVKVGKAILQQNPPSEQYTPHIIEAGSGWGTLAFQLAKDCPTVRIRGIENSPIPLWYSRLLARLQRLGITFQQGDLYHYAYTEADIVVCYLFPGAMNRLAPILERQCRKNTYVISVYFALPGWEPERVIRCRDLHRTPVYVYRYGHQSYLI